MPVPWEDEVLLLEIKRILGNYNHKIFQLLIWFWYFCMPAAPLNSDMDLTSALKISIQRALMFEEQRKKKACSSLHETSLLMMQNCELIYFFIMEMIRNLK